MATKKEWAAYFELINDRQPTAEETLQVPKPSFLQFPSPSWYYRTQMLPSATWFHVAVSN